MWRKPARKNLAIQSWMNSPQRSTIKKMGMLQPPLRLLVNVRRGEPE